MKTYSEIPKSLPVTPMLDKIDYPSDLKQLNKNVLLYLPWEKLVEI